MYGVHAGMVALPSSLSIPLFLEDAGLLAAFTHHSHIVDYAPVDSLSCSLPASSMILGIIHKPCWTAGHELPIEPNRLKTTV
jgi:hypothetical protein